MPKILVLYYSSYGHIETMAQAIAEGARSAGADVDIKRVPETVSEAVARKAHYKLDQTAPVATIAELEHYDAIIVGTGTRFGRISSQMAAFLDQGADCGRAVPFTVKWVGLLPRQELSMADRKLRSSQSLPTCCISA